MRLFSFLNLSRLQLVFVIMLFGIQPQFSVAESLPGVVEAAMSQINKDNTKAERVRKGVIKAAAGVPAEVVDAVAAISKEVTHIGAKEASPPVWPLFWKTEQVGWAFDTGDLVNLPGFAGTPIDVLVVMDQEGGFVGVKVLRQNEPVFQHGVGPERMSLFADQYAGLSLKQNIKVRIRSSDGEEGGANSFIDGITMATASVVVMNDTILLAALKVASQKLAGFSYQEPGKVLYDHFEPKSWDELVAEGLVQKQSIQQGEVDALFAGTNVDSLSEGEPDEPFIELYFAHLNVPTIGRNVLGDEEFKRLLNEEMEPDEQIILVAANGPYSFLGEKFVEGSVPDRLGLFQDELAIEIRDLEFYRFYDRETEHLPDFEEFKLFKVKSASIFDPAKQWNLKLLVKRSRGFLYENHTRSFSFDYNLPHSYLFIPKSRDEREEPWVQIWKSRTVDIAILLVSLVIVTAVFLYQRRLVESTRRLRWVRWVFLFYTLGFIGWYAQGQLSIVNIYPIVRAFWEGFNLSTYLIDPITFILWLYVFISVFLWGRGLFCGWLCPFGALQEMIGWVAKKLRIRQWKIAESRHKQLWKLKYLLLIGLVGVSVFSTNQAIVLSEVEPFKTVITEEFVRYWPFVIYALVTLGLGLFVHKFYCRYLCPLGAGLAILGWFHRFEWLDRRKECGSPCKFCNKVCEIRAIEPTGAINYNECIQCLDCVAVLKADDRCVVRMLEIKKERKHSAM
jgi:NosR/NirI family nitrous oxide reductase transcriptional regulator